MGTILGLGNTILWRIAILNGKTRLVVERNLEKYRQECEKIPEEKVADVPPEIGVPIIEKLTYVSNDDLSDLYINLLAKASSLDYAHTAHPSFVNIITNLSPDEAILLQHIKGRVPFVEPRRKMKTVNEWQELPPGIFTDLESRANLSYQENIGAYMSNFEGCGLIKVRRDIVIAFPRAYENIERAYRERYESMIQSRPGLQLVFSRGQLEMTSFGELFAAACFTKIMK